MTIQQWLFSFKGRIGRRDFWIWIATWVVAMLLLFFVAYNAWLSTQTAAFALVCLLWPTAAVVVKRLHDRGRSGAWAFPDYPRRGCWWRGTGHCCPQSSHGWWADCCRRLSL